MIHDIPPSARGRRIPELPDALDLTGNELIPISQNGVTKKMTIHELVAYAIAQHRAEQQPHQQYELGDVLGVYNAAKTGD